LQVQRIDSNSDPFGFPSRRAVGSVGFSAAVARSVAANNPSLLLGEAIERDANRREAYSRTGAPWNPPSARRGVPSRALLALPEAPFSPRKPARSNEPEGIREESASDASSATQKAPVRAGQTEEAAPAE
jgi:hypothetical protein